VVRSDGPDPARGHALRELGASTANARPAEVIPTEVLVVGAGAAGASAVWRLRRAGVRNLQLVELEAETGGTARSGSTSRSRNPLGAHYLPVPPREFAELHVLLRDLGILVGREGDGTPRWDSRSVCAAPLERHFAAGKWFEGLYPADGETGDEAVQWERFQAMLGELGGRRGSDGRPLFTLPLARSSVDLRGLDAMPMSAWLDREGLSSPRLRWLVDYACRDDYGGSAASISAFAALHHFLARGLEEDREATILTWPEGNHRLVSGMLTSAELGDALLTGAAVVRCDPGGTVDVFDFAAQRLRRFEARVVLWAAPRFVLAHVLPAGVDPLSRGALPYTPWLVATARLRRAPAGWGAPLSWDNVAVGADHLGYVIPHHGEAPRATNGETAVTYYRPLDAPDLPGLVEHRRQLLAASPEALAAEVLADLSAMHPGLERDAAEVVITKWGHGMIRPIPGLLFGPDLALARKALGAIVPCAADVSGLPLFEEAFAGGCAAADEALRRLGREVPTWT
jgi:hypothetical protein